MPAPQPTPMSWREHAELHARRLAIQADHLAGQLRRGDEPCAFAGLDLQTLAHVIRQALDELQKPGVE